MEKDDFNEVAEIELWEYFNNEMEYLISKGLNSEIAGQIAVRLFIAKRKELILLNYLQKTRSSLNETEKTLEDLINTVKNRMMNKDFIYYRDLVETLIGWVIIWTIMYFTNLVSSAFWFYSCVTAIVVIVLYFFKKQRL